MASKRIQSAMEYLMTYGWAVLIIAVVLGALFGLGFFNSTVLAPKVSAGSCQVYRPLGSATTSFINLIGTCNNELPQYAAQFNAQSYVTISTEGLSNIPSTGVTFSSWIYFTQSQSALAANSATITSTPTCGYDIWFSTSTGMRLSDNGGHGVSFSYTFTPNQWYYVTATATSGSSPTETLYVNGVQVSQGSTTTWDAACGSTAYIGAFTPSTGHYSGSISNLQIYNTSLSSNEIAALYDEGIGGAPLLLNNLVGWWSLNGNANDYSGNLNNGVPTNVIYTSSWTAGYIAP